MILLQLLVPPSRATPLVPSDYPHRLQLLRSQEVAISVPIPDVVVPIDLERVAPDFAIDNPVFVDSDGVTALAHETESDGTTSLHWVRLPELSDDEAIWVYWGADDLPEKKDVWPDALGIWHLTDLQDSVEGPLLLETILPSDIDGLLAGGVYAPPLPAAFDLDLTAANLSPPYTLSAWLRPTGLGSGLLAAVETSGAPAFLIDQCPYGSSQVQLRVLGFISGCIDVPLGEWTHFAVTVTSEHHVLNVDGAEVTIAVPGLSIVRVTVAPLSGGDIDELRVFHAERSPDQLAVDAYTGHTPLFGAGAYESDPSTQTTPDTGSTDRSTSPDTGADTVSEGPPGDWSAARLSGGGCRSLPWQGSGGTTLSVLAVLWRRSRRAGPAQAS